MGSDTDFKRINLSAIHYLPISRELTLGIMGGAILSYGDAVLSASLRQSARRLGDALPRDHAGQLELSCAGSSGSA